MKVCLFGSYVKDSFGIPSGNGGILLKKILELQNIEVIECHKQIDNVLSFIPTYVNLFLKHRKLQYDLMIIPWRGILTLPLAKLIHKKPIMFFPAFSIYDTLVNDRKKIKKDSFKAKLIHFVDKLACKWSDKVILESTEEINYFINEFNLPKDKFLQYHLSADESIFHPNEIENINENKFIILFFGSFIPLHGIETIVEASNILKDEHDIVFKICGDGQTRPDIEKKINEKNLNIELLGIVPKEKLVMNIKNSNVCLGIFGDTEKAHKVVTNKVFQILASKKPLITMESPASLEANLIDKKNCLLVPPADPHKLAEAIMFLKKNPDICKEISEKGYKNYCEFLSMHAVGNKLVSYATELINNRR